MLGADYLSSNSKEILCNRSDYFKKMFEGRFQESEEQLACLPDEYPAVFSLFLEWIYKDRLAKFSLADSTCSSGPFMDRVKLYPYAGKICMPDLEDYVMSDMIASCQYHRCWPSPQAVLLAYEGIVPGSKLRTFMADSFYLSVTLVEANSGSIARLPSGFFNNADLLRDILSLLAKDNDNDTHLPGVELRKADKCKYHNHVGDLECPYKDFLLCPNTYIMRQ